MSDRYPQPPARDPRRPFVPAPFTRLARTHAFSVAGDALFTVGLAGTVFFQVPLGEAKPRVGLYLLLTFAPFAVAAPMIGPLIDRIKGGRRWAIILSLALRGLLCVLLVRDLTHLTFYLEAFLMLVFGKAYMISKAAVVPTTVRSDEELVEANSKLSLLSGVAAVAAAIPGAILLKLGGKELGPQLTVGLAAIMFVVGAAFASRLPRVVVADEPEGAAEKLELRSAGIRLAASAMSLFRVSVGLLLLVLAFAFKNGEVQLWFVGAAGLMAQAGVLAGAGLAPRLRKVFTEPRIIAGSLGFTGVAAILAYLMGGVVGASLLAFALGMTGGTAKQAFDALVQRDAPDANRGRSFARFESRFQLAWVLGAFLPVILPISIDLGFMIIAVLMVAGLATYLLGLRRVAGGTYEWETPSRRIWREARTRLGRSGPPAEPDRADGGRADGGRADGGPPDGGPADAGSAWPAAPPPVAPPNRAASGGHSASAGGAPRRPATVGSSRRERRRRTRDDEWQPPEGFVAQPLGEVIPGEAPAAGTDPTRVGIELTGAASRAAAGERVTRAFDGEAVDPTTVEARHDDATQVASPTRAPAPTPPPQPAGRPAGMDQPSLPFDDGDPVPGGGDGDDAGDDRLDGSSDVTRDLPLVEPRWRDHPG